MGTGGEGLNNEDLGLGLEINGDLRLNNRGLMKKSGSLEGAVAPAAPPMDPPLFLLYWMSNRTTTYYNSLSQTHKEVLFRTLAI